MTQVESTSFQNSDTQTLNTSRTFFTKANLPHLLTWSFLTTK